MRIPDQVPREDLDNQLKNTYVSNKLNEGIDTFIQYKYPCENTDQIDITEHEQIEDDRSFSEKMADLQNQIKLLQNMTDLQNQIKLLEDRYNAIMTSENDNETVLDEDEDEDTETDSYDTDGDSYSESEDADIDSGAIL